MVIGKTTLKYFFLTIFFFAITSLSYGQLSYASFKNGNRLEENRVKQFAISFEVFNKEFIFTNSIGDYHRSFERLINKYNIGIPKEKLSEIYSELTKNEKTIISMAVKKLISEANKFSYYRDNNYYQSLITTISKSLKLNIAARIEITLVDEYNKAAAIITPYSKQSNKIRYLHLLNQARYELVSAILYDVSNIN